MACLKLFYKFKHDNVPDYFLQMFSSRDNLRPRRIVRVPQRVITNDIIVQNEYCIVLKVCTQSICPGACQNVLFLS